MFKKLTDKKSYQFLLTVFLLLIIISATGCQSKDIVASVGDEEITKDELYERLVEQNGKQVLDSLIYEKIIESEVEKQNIEVSEEDLEKEMKKIIDYYGGEDAFNQALETAGYSVDDVKKDVRKNT